MSKKLMDILVYRMYTILLIVAMFPEGNMAERGPRALLSLDIVPARAESLKLKRKIDRLWAVLAAEIQISPDSKKFCFLIGL